MTRLFRDGGSLISIFPGEVDNVEDVPWDFMYALTHAFRILSWQENLLEEERPPEWMWPFEDELEIWFEEVDRARKEKYSTDSSGDELPDGGYMYNEAAERFRN